MKELLSNKKFYSYWKNIVSSCELWDTETKEKMTLDKKLVRIKPNTQNLISFISQEVSEFYVHKTEEGLFIIVSDNKSSIADNIYDSLVEFIC